MRPTENIEKLVRKLRYRAGDRTRQRILGNVLEALEDKEQNSANIQPNIWVIISKSRVTQIGAAVVIIIAISLFLMPQEQPQQIQTQQIAQASKSPGELTTFASLSFAYRRGGMEAVEEIFDKVFEMTGPRPAKISIGELLEESNGT